MLSRNEPMIHGLTENEIPEIVDIYIRSSFSSYKSFIDDTLLMRYLQPDSIYRYFMQEFRQNTCAIFTAIRNNVCAGFIELKSCTAGIEICKLYISESHQRRGTGNLLAAFAEGKAKSEGVKEITAWVLESNVNAIAFYAKNRFEQTDGTRVLNRYESIQRLFTKTLSD